MREWMTVHEAACYFGIDENDIRSHLKKGCLDSNCYGYPLRLTDAETDVFFLPFDCF